MQARAARGGIAAYLCALNDRLGNNGTSVHGTLVARVLLLAYSGQGRAIGIGFKPYNWIYVAYCPGST